MATRGYIRASLAVQKQSPEVQLDGTGGVKVGNANNKNGQKNGQAGSDAGYSNS